MLRNTTRTRSFGGCGTCRSRHMKCDEKRPECSNCQAHNLECTGYVRTIFFESVGSNDCASRYRQLLFSDTERCALNVLMTSQIPVSKTHAAIHTIDQACEKALEGLTSAFEIRRGPFGAFRLEDAIPSLPPSPFLKCSLGYPIIPPIQPDFGDFDNFFLPEWIETSPFLDSGECILSPSLFTADEPHALRGQASALNSPSNSYIEWSLQTNLETPYLQGLDEAPLLLKHYADNVITAFTPYRHTKTPWHVLFLPNAKTTLAELTMGQRVNDANLTTFYGILAISSLDLQRHSSGSRWQAEATSYEQKAQQCFHSVLQHSLDQPKSLKYKSIVMGILVMIEISMITGSWEETDTYFLEAERVIRLRGLTKKQKSRKVRLLHHCYTYMRVLHESLSLLPTRSCSHRTIMNSIEESGAVVPYQDPLSFRLMPWVDLDKKIAEAKNREQGENDLHLYVPGSWTATLYPEIFGVPETWLLLLSQVIRLGNERELSETICKDSPMPLKDYLRRAKDLESCVLRWEASAMDAVAFKVSQSGRKEDDVDLVALDSMLCALRHALAIYFYRRILDVGPELLQPKVIKVKDFLFTCGELGRAGGGHLRGLIWPAFIAGCEANSPDLQGSFSKWFNLCTQQNNYSSFRRMRLIMERVWRDRSNESFTDMSWVVLMRTMS